MVLKEAARPKVAGWLLSPPGKTSCLDPGKKEYTVDELRASYLCSEKQAEKVRGQLGSLQKVVKGLDPEVVGK